jgi:tetratricopeptide (TPR) repeat protein
MKGLGMRLRRAFWALGAVLLLAAGGAAALFLANRRDVTTSSAAAYQAYQEAVADEGRFYFKEARLGYARALELDPHFAMAMLGLARQSGEGASEQRKALLRRATREESRLTEHERYLVDMALAFNEKRQADGMKIARELRAKYPDDMQAASVLAHEQLARGDTGKAIRIFEEVLAVDPNNAEAYNQIGYYYGYQGDYDKAMEYLKKYQFIAANSANPFDSLGEVQANSGHYNEAIENLNRALAIKPDFAPAFWHLGVVYEGMGDYPKAIESYWKAADLDDKQGMPRYYGMMALRVAFFARDWQAVKQGFDRLAKLPDANDENREVRGGFLEAVLALSEGRASAAEQTLLAIRPKLEARWEDEYKSGVPGLRPHFPEWNAVMATALEAQGRTDEALQLWEANANPPNPFRDFLSRTWIMEARARVAAIVAKKGDLDRAEKLIAENRKWNPSWAPCRDSEKTVAELRRAKVLAASR